MWDNGATYTNEQFSLICGSIGTVLLHTKVRDGASKAKVERHFRTLKERWLYALDLDAISSLAQFNALLLDYMRTYNTTCHTGIDTTPFDRCRDSCAQVRRPQSGQRLDECFFNRVMRKVNKDSTVSIDKVSYDVPLQFISMRVEIRFFFDDMSSAYILCDGVHYPIRRTDRNENCRTKRDNPPSMSNRRPRPSISSTWQVSRFTAEAGAFTTKRASFPVKALFFSSYRWKSPRSPAASAAGLAPSNIPAKSSLNS